MKPCRLPILRPLVLAVLVVMSPAATFSDEIMFLMNDEFNPTEGDEVQLGIFEERGDTVDIWDNNRLQNDAFEALEVADEADLVYIDESVSSSRADPIIDTITPVLNNEQFAFDNWMMTEAPTEHGSPDTPDLFGGSHVGTEIQIIDEQHPIIRSAGMANGIVQVYEDDGRIDWGFPGPEADIVAIIPGFEDLDPAGAIFVYEEGDELVDGTPAPGMRIGFFISDTDGGGTGREATLLTDAGIALLNAAIDYGLGITGLAPKLQAGDADQDLDFDQLDLVKVQIAAKYLSGQPATWGEGDWNGAPGGSQGNPPTGDGKFDQLDIIAALSAGFYLQPGYGAINDVTAVGSLAGGGALGEVDVLYVPEPSTAVLLSIGFAIGLFHLRRINGPN